MQQIKKSGLKINEEIRDREVRLIDSEGNMIGVMSISQAQEMANSKSLDLVKIAPQANPPVCRIMDYGKYMFELSKKDKEARKKQKVIGTKEIRLTPSIEEHDYQFKLKNSLKFLKNGDKVKISIRFRGREVSHSSAGYEIMNRFAKDADEFAVVEKNPKLEGRNMTMILAPK